jgi:hypothetical protein
MATRKRRSILSEESFNAFEGLLRPKRETPAPDICSLPLEGISPALDPNRALLRRVFFLNEDRNKYVSVAFYPEQGYAALVEFGAAKAAPLRLTEQHFATLTEHLPGLIQALCADSYFTSGVHDNFAIRTGGSYRTGWLTLGFGRHSKTLPLKLTELLYLNSIMYIVANQLTRYSEATVDVMNYSTTALASSEFIEPLPYYSKHVLYRQLFEELKAITLI